MCKAYEVNLAAVRTSAVDTCRGRSKKRPTMSHCGPRGATLSMIWQLRTDRRQLVPPGGRDVSTAANASLPL